MDEGIGEGRDEGRRDERNVWTEGRRYTIDGRREELWTITLGKMKWLVVPERKRGSRRKGKKELERKVREEGGQKPEGGNIQQREKGRIEEGSTNLLHTYCGHHGQPTCQFGEQLCLSNHGLSEGLWCAPCGTLQHGVVWETTESWAVVRTLCLRGDTCLWIEGNQNEGGGATWR